MSTVPGQAARLVVAHRHVFVFVGVAVVVDVNPLTAAGQTVGLPLAVVVTRRRARCRRCIAPVAWTIVPAYAAIVADAADARGVVVVVVAEVHVIVGAFGTPTPERVAGVDRGPGTTTTTRSVTLSNPRPVSTGVGLVYEGTAKVKRGVP